MAEGSHGIGRSSPGPGYYAHTAPDGSSDWQSLPDHLRGVATRSGEFAGAFGAHDWGYLAGLWHDIGKYSTAFQDYLKHAADTDVHESDTGPRTDHSTAGAQLAVRRLGPVGHLLAYPIAGHHSGLLDSIGPSACLEKRLSKEVQEWQSEATSDLVDRPSPELPPFLRSALGDRNPMSVSFFVRMLFSCVVDADFLDTAVFMDPTRESARPRWPADILKRMEDALELHIEGFGEARTEVDRRRAEVHQACVSAASRAPGLFSLTVPTGGGKTLSSLAFAVKHARVHGLRRIIYVAPFTSIIEQNAEVFRDAVVSSLGPDIPDPLIEHHSNLDPERETTQSRLAAENWDAPLVVTTAVQFYESLFANRPSQCRKLHNLTRAVIVLDEAQCLPVDFLHPCLRALEELSANYEVSVVLCTATQPAVSRREEFPIGVELPRSREIVEDPPALFSALKRVTVVKETTLSDEVLAERLAQHDQVLCIVNTRSHARRLFERLGEHRSCFHLSANMCPQHRTEVLTRIKAALVEGRECQVISTQVVEAGVDIDFPVVYRALAGLDSIAQAAGRCNRNGRRTMGQTFVFESEHSETERFLAGTADSARQVLALHDDPMSLDAVNHYFRLYYWNRKDGWDRHKVLDRFRLDRDNPGFPFLFDFATAARDFRIIEEIGVTVIVPWGPDGEDLSERLRSAWPGPTRELLRRLQRYTVQVSPQAWREHGKHAFEMVDGQYPLLSFPERHYSDSVGLRLDTAVGDALIF